MSGLEFNYQSEAEVEMFEVSERLALTEPDENGGQRAVPEDHAEARWLWAIPGQKVPLEEAERYGLVAAAKKPAAKAAAKKPAAKAAAKKPAADDE